jgi:hypothetical protein
MAMVLNRPSDSFVDLPVDEAIFGLSERRITMSYIGSRHPECRELLMSEVDLEAQGEAVQKFFRSLAADPEGTLVRVKGRPVARLVPIADKNGDAGNDAGWTKEKNRRRCFLIDREIDGTITPEEVRELALLQRQVLDHRDRVAPLPLEATRRLYEELIAKAEAARKP